MKKDFERIKIVYEEGFLPTYETEGSVGCDLRACIEEPIVLAPLQRTVVPSGIRIQLPEGYEAQIRPRSGLAAKQGLVTVLGTIDSDYRGFVGVIMINLSNEQVVIEPKERIAQMVISKCSFAVWSKVDHLDSSKRGEGGFGHTGTK